MNITPEAQQLWHGIGGHFDSFTQVICEFIDNSISNFNAHASPHKTVNLTLRDVTSKGKEPGTVKVFIEDAGTGIKEFEPVLRLGDISVRETPLNEHGFGLKHALASADPENRNWKIYSRTEADYGNDKYKTIFAPYSFNIKQNEVKNSKQPWPGIFNGSGTIVEFTCTKTFFDTIQKGIQGKAGFDKCLTYLREELGYIYAGMIKKGMVVINIKSTAFNETVGAVEPDWQGFYKPAQGKADKDLGGGSVSVEYTFGEMGRGNHIKHYKRNMSTSGVEVRVNGRVLMSNVFKAIWELENHPSFNHFLVIINLESNKRDALPKTRTSKNGIRTGDEKLENLFEWIKMTCPNPPKDTAGAVSEKELVEELAKAKEMHIREKTKHIETEFKVFNKIGSPVSVDLYVFDGTDVVLYEAKKDTADVQDVYQLLMYWDGAVSDGTKPTEGILVASYFSDGVDTILSLLNASVDQNGNKYNFSKKTWSEEGLAYPKVNVP